jgi:DHA3 family macrolide efflux protein-like MFS transporter
MSLLARYAGFRWLWIGQFLSQLGNAVFLVMGLWEIQLHSPFLLSIAGLAMMVPGSLAVVGGTVVDRHDPRRLMLWTDLLRGVAVLFGLGALLVRHDALIPAIIVLLGVNSLGASLFGPAESVLLPWLVDDPDLPAANGVYSLTNLLSQTIGSAIGGAAIAAIGVAFVFGLDMASFWLSALAILLMMRVVARRARQEMPGAPQEPEGPGLFTSLRTGWRGLGELPWLVRLMPAILATNFAFSAAFTMLPYWSRHALHTGALGFGLLNAAWALGMVVGSLAVGLFTRWPFRTTASLLALVLGVVTLAFAWSPWLIVSLVALLLSGASNGVLNAMVFTLMQRAIPEAIRGRALGVFISFLTIATPAGALASGLLLPVLPLSWSWVLSGVVGVALAFIMWRSLPRDVAEPEASAPASSLQP